VRGYLSPDEGFAASSWWFRTERGSVLVDAPLLADHSSALRREMETAGGLPGAVLLLSSRPEASWGGAALGGPRTRTWTSKQIADSLESGARSGRESLLRSGLALERLPAAPPRPTNTFSGTLNLGFEGFTLRLIELSEAGPSAPLVAFVPETGELFAGDLLCVRVHPDSAGLDHHGWQRSLDALARMRPRRVFPGRGPATGPDALGALKRYLETIEESVQGFVAKGRRRLGGRELAAARAKVVKRYPDWRLPEALDQTLPAEYTRQYRLRFDAEP
jgi:glyoxylase-like metal-dependent hydrolase (beta-lactamase superfamily II)